MFFERGEQAGGISLKCPAKRGTRWPDKPAPRPTRQSEKKANGGGISEKREKPRFLRGRELKRGGEREIELGSGGGDPVPIQCHLRDAAHRRRGKSAQANAAHAPVHTPPPK